MNPIVKQDTLDLFIGQGVAILWKDWATNMPKDMRLSRLSDEGFVVHGICPHCQTIAAFATIHRPVVDETVDPHKMIGAASCIACNNYVLVILDYQIRGNAWRWDVQDYYPVGKPDDFISDSVPEPIRLDFQEALRCRWVDAYNATIEMCRRSLESSCIEQGADKDLVLSKMIDWVHGQGKITTPLKDMAHKIKLGGNRAAHPSDRTLTDKDADAVIEFTREYFQHVYVMPAKMAELNYEKKPKKGT